MPDLSPIPMLAGEWRLRLGELCRDCALADSGEQADLLRVARALLAIAPEDAAGLDIGALPGAYGFERLLEVGAWESAALDLMPADANFMTSRAGTGTCLASVALPGMEEEVTSEGDTLAMALTSALAAALAMLPAQAVSAHRQRRSERDFADSAARRAMVSRLN